MNRFNRMKLMAAALGLCVLTSVVQGAEEKKETKTPWTFTAAEAQAKATKKPLMIIFSGSDWCGWCIRLDKEVFDKAAFKKYAKDNLVVYVADFPRRSKLSAEVAQQNEMLVKKYRVEGFPTVVIVNADGREIARTGYQAGGPEKYVQHLKSIIK